MRQGAAKDVAHHPQEKTEGRLDVSLFVRSTLVSQRSPIVHTAVTFSCVLVLASDQHGNKQCEDGLSLNEMVRLRRRGQTAEAS